MKNHMERDYSPIEGGFNTAYWEKGVPMSVQLKREREQLFGKVNKADPAPAYNAKNAQRIKRQLDDAKERMKTIDDKGLYSIREAAVYLRVAVVTLRVLVLKGAIHCTVAKNHKRGRHDRKYQFLGMDLRKFKEAKEVQS